MSNNYAMKNGTDRCQKPAKHTENVNNIMMMVNIMTPAALKLDAGFESIGLLLPILCGHQSEFKSETFCETITAGTLE